MKLSRLWGRDAQDERGKVETKPSRAGELDFSVESFVYVLAGGPRPGLHTSAANEAIDLGG